MHVGRVRTKHIAKPFGLGSDDTTVAQTGRGVAQHQIGAARIAKHEIHANPDEAFRAGTQLSKGAQAGVWTPDHRSADLGHQRWKNRIRDLIVEHMRVGHAQQMVGPFLKATNSGLRTGENRITTDSDFVAVPAE